ncbi:cell division topological specificity factor MinE [Helicobacter trogontum]|uniref:Cell division topological specificity factor n=1 Tax=Helicobacter trogontum TaxID=50960 RepID=A0A4U8S9U3_9HELI|nr:cell division topological specificity factor MinE [Helicobacter trogontum]TLD82803.1 hypothetical protein LS81_006875 [Helicobacter trogontum]
MLFLFRNKSESSGTATLAKNRLNNVLINERGLQINYLDNLTKDITNLMKQYAKTPHIVVNATAYRNNVLDIQICIGKTEQ